jgi:acyl carrier protein
MTRDEFLVQMQDILQTDEELRFDMELDSLDEWDSLSKMATVAFLDSNFGVKTNFSDFEQMRTIEDVAKKAGL